MTASGAAAAATGGAPLNMGASCTATRPASADADSPALIPSNRWVSKALAARGGADEPAETPGGIPGVMSEVEIALSSFNDIVGENLVVVDNAKKGTTKEVSVQRTVEGRGVRMEERRGWIGPRPASRCKPWVVSFFSLRSTATCAALRYPTRN